MAHVKILHLNQDKLNNRTVRCIFVRYMKRTNGYRLYNVSVRLIEIKYIKFLKLDNNFEKPLDDQPSNDLTEFIDGNLTYNDELVSNKPTIDQFDNKPTDK